MDTKLTSFSEKCLKKIGRLSTVIFLLNHKNSNNIIDGTVEAAWKQVFQRWKMCWYNLRNWSNWTLKARFGWNLNAMVTVVLTKWRGISFHSWKLSSYIQEHWRLAIFMFISTFLRPPVAKELHRVQCWIFGVERFQRKFFCIFSISPIICFGATDVRHKWTI